MADTNAIELIKRGDKKFSARATLDQFWQEVALNFVPWQACFTQDLMWGEDFAAHLMESTPVLLARDLSGQIGSMLRPVGKQWFNVRTPFEKLNNDRRIREVLDWRSQQMMRIMYDRVTGFTRATKQTDEFFAVFGNAVLHCDLSIMQDSLRYGAHHIKDCVWSLGPEGLPNKIQRKERISLRNMRARYGEKAIQGTLKQLIEKDDDHEVTIRHDVIPADEYDFYKKGLKRKAGQFASVWTCEHEGGHILREATQPTFRYIIPRWTHQRNSPYALSLASVIGLPDARLIQAQARAMQEAAEKSINPPLVGYGDTVRGDVRLDAGGLTWIDRQAFEMTGSRDPIHVLETGKNFRLGVDMMMRTEQMLAKAFYLDVLRLPDTRATKSVPEIQFRIDEYVRAALPLFAPIEAEYNGAVCHETYQMIKLAGGFQGGPELPPDVEEALEMQFQWDNPLQEMLERQKAQRVSELGTLAQATAALEAASGQSLALQQVDAAKMFREAAIGIGTASWLKDEEQSAQGMGAVAQQAGVQNLLVNSKNIAQLVDAGVNAASAVGDIPNPAEPSFSMLPSQA